MKKLVGIAFFWCLWPVFWLYLRYGGTRTRLLLVCGGEFLLVRSWLGSGRWSLPGGGLHKNEKSTEGVRREVKEETGIELAHTQVSYAYQAIHSESGFKFVYDCYVCELPRKPSVTVQRWEIADYSWQPLDNPDLPLGDDAKKALAWWQKRL